MGTKGWKKTSSPTKAQTKKSETHAEKPMNVCAAFRGQQRKLYRVWYMPSELTFEKWNQALLDLAAIGVIVVIDWPMKATDFALVEYPS